MKNNKIWKVFEIEAICKCFFTLSNKKKNKSINNNALVFIVIIALFGMVFSPVSSSQNGNPSNYDNPPDIEWDYTYGSTSYAESGRSI